MGDWAIFTRHYAVTNDCTGADVSNDILMGYEAGRYEISPYGGKYKNDEYYWGIEPSTMCLKVLELFPPSRPLKLLDIDCCCRKLGDLHETCSGIL